MKIFIVLKKVHLYQLIILICIIGEVLFSFIWEAKGRYVFPCFVLIIPLACIGIVLMYEKIFKFLKNLVYKNRLENYGNN